MTTDVVGRFDQLGWIEPFDLLTEEQRRSLLALEVPDARKMTWDKGLATVSPLVHGIASTPSLVERVRSLLGDDVMLWGARLIRQEPGVAHRWHTDAETELAGGPTVDVWVAVDHVSPASTLRLVPGTHRHVPNVKDRRQEHALLDVPDETVLAWAREQDEQADVEIPEVKDGQALLFDGRVWHATSNTGDHVRTSLLLQYAPADVPVWIPRYNTWPPEPRVDIRPPCVMVHGAMAAAANRFVPPPDGVVGRASWIHTIPVPIVGDATGPREHHHVFEGPTTSTAYLEVHASTLRAGQIPHPPHHHPHEEVLIVLEGDPELILVEDGVERRVPTSRGTVGWYPLGPHHTLQAVNGDATYVMFRWYSGESGVEEPLLPLTVVDTDRVLAEADHEQPGRGPQPTLFEGPTRYLARLQAHATVLRPGEGYEAHTDGYDIVVVVLSGAVTSNGTDVVRANDLLFWPAGLPHAARNDGDEDAVYIVLELHPGRDRALHVPPLRRFGRWLLPTSAKKWLKRHLPIPDHP